jgi:hypothetical protein
VRVEPHACANPEAWNTSRLRLLKDSDAGDAEKIRDFDSSQRMITPLELVR